MSPSPAPKAQSQATARTVLTALGLLLLFAGLAWVWTSQAEQTRSLAQLGDRMDRSESQLRSLQQQFAALEQKIPAPPPRVDLAPLEQRLAALENKPPPPPAPAPDPALPGRLAALEQAQAQDAAQAERIAALEKSQADNAARAERLATLEKAQTDATARASRLAALQAANAALQAGRPLGNLPNAPAPLSRFATEAPPREAQLRADFADASARALAASRPPDTAQGMADRITQKFRALVTVRDGDRVLVGPPAATVLAEAQTRLDAGNLAAAIATLDRLDPPALAAMTEWRDRARALVDARAAMATMMGAP